MLGGEIKDLGLIEPNIIDADYEFPLRNFGCLVGQFEYGNINGCYVQGGSIEVKGWVREKAADYVGGLVGYVTFGTISNCYSTASVKGIDCAVGGLVGGNSSGGTCYRWVGRME